MIKQIIQFIQNHWVLCSATVVILIVLIFEEMRKKISGVPMLSAQEVSLLLNRENAVIVDLRNQNAFATGHILGAINISHNEIELHLKKLEAHKNKTIILVDDQDTNISSVGAKLRIHGFIKIHALAKGLNSWKEAQLPLVKN